VKNIFYLIVLLLFMPAFGHEFIQYVDGMVAGEQFGSAMCTIDFNDDGYTDLVISAPASDEGGISSGKVYIYYGGNTLDYVPDLQIIGPAGSFFGKSVSSAGDFNADGITDLMVGAPYYDTPSPNTGAVFIYYGADGPDTIADLIIYGEAAGDYFGINLVSVGDFNNDTYDDIAVGAYKADWGGFTDAGKVYVYYGGTSADNSADRILVGDGDGERFGFALTAGDYDNSGSADVTVGAYSFDNDYLNQGRIYIFNGGSMPDTIYDLAFTGAQAGDKFGWSLSTGYINDDEYADVIMGSDGYSVGNYETGKMYLFFGGAIMDNTVDYEYSLNRSADDYLGFAVVSGVDPDNDGDDDILIGMPGNDDGAEDAGGAVLISGGNYLWADTLFYGGSSLEQMGKSIGFWKNADDSDVTRLILGASSYENYLGRIYIYRYVSSGAPDCGDANGDGVVNVFDVTFIISFLYLDGQQPEPLEIADVNNSGAVNIFDITHLISFLYLGGSAPECP